MAGMKSLTREEKVSLFPWIEFVEKEFAKSVHCDYEFGVLQLFHSKVETELENISMKIAPGRTKALFAILKDFYNLFCWKTNWKQPSTYMKMSCVQLLSDLIKVGLTLSKGCTESNWLNRILSMMKIFPGSEDLLYDALLLVSNLKKKYQKVYSVILRQMLCSSKHELREPVSYFKVLLLFRRLKCLTVVNGKSEIISLATRVKVPLKTKPWLQSHNLDARWNEKVHSIAKQFMKNSFDKSVLAELREIIFREICLKQSHSREENVSNAEPFTIDTVGQFPHQGVVEVVAERQCKMDGGKKKKKKGANCPKEDISGSSKRKSGESLGEATGPIPKKKKLKNIKKNQDSNLGKEVLQSSPGSLPFTKDELEMVARLAKGETSKRGAPHPIISNKKLKIAKHEEEIQPKPSQYVEFMKEVPGGLCAVPIDFIAQDSKKESKRTKPKRKKKSLRNHGDKGIQSINEPESQNIFNEIYTENRSIRLMKSSVVSEPNEEKDRKKEKRRKKLAKLKVKSQTTASECEILGGSNNSSQPLCPPPPEKDQQKLGKKSAQRKAKAGKTVSEGEILISSDNPIEHYSFFIPSLKEKDQQKKKRSAKHKAEIQMTASECEISGSSKNSSEQICPPPEKDQQKLKKKSSKRKAKVPQTISEGEIIINSDNSIEQCIPSLPEKDKQKKRKSTAKHKAEIQVTAASECDISGSSNNSSEQLCPSPPEIEQQTLGKKSAKRKAWAQKTVSEGEIIISSDNSIEQLFSSLPEKVQQKKKKRSAKHKAEIQATASECEISCSSNNPSEQLCLPPEKDKQKLKKKSAMVPSTVSEGEILINSDNSIEQLFSSLPEKQKRIRLAKHKAETQKTSSECEILDGSNDDSSEQLHLQGASIKLIDTNVVSIGQPMSNKVSNEIPVHLQDSMDLPVSSQMATPKESANENVDTLSISENDSFEDTKAFNQHSAHRSQDNLIEVEETSNSIPESGVREFYASHKQSTIDQFFTSDEFLDDDVEEHIPCGQAFKTAGADSNDSDPKTDSSMIKECMTKPDLQNEEQDNSSDINVETEFHTLREEFACDHNVNDSAISKLESADENSQSLQLELNSSDLESSQSITTGFSKEDSTDKVDFNDLSHTLNQNNSLKPSDTELTSMPVICLEQDSEVGTSLDSQSEFSTQEHDKIMKPAHLDSDPIDSVECLQEDSKSNLSDLSLSESDLVEQESTLNDVELNKNLSRTPETVVENVNKQIQNNMDTSETVSETNDEYCKENFDSNEVLPTLLEPKVETLEEEEQLNTAECMKSEVENGIECLVEISESDKNYLVLSSNIGTDSNLTGVFKPSLLSPNLADDDNSESHFVENRKKENELSPVINEDENANLNWDVNVKYGIDGDHQDAGATNLCIASPVKDSASGDCSLIHEDRSDECQNEKEVETGSLTPQQNFLRNVNLAIKGGKSLENCSSSSLEPVNVATEELSQKPMSTCCKSDTVEEFDDTVTEPSLSPLKCTGENIEDSKKKSELCLDNARPNIDSDDNITPSISKVEDHSNTSDDFVNRDYIEFDSGEAQKISVPKVEKGGVKTENSSDKIETKLEESITESSALGSSKDISHLMEKLLNRVELVDFAKDGCTFEVLKSSILKPVIKLTPLKHAASNTSEPGKFFGCETEYVSYSDISEKKVGENNISGSLATDSASGNSPQFVSYRELTSDSPCVMICSKTEIDTNEFLSDESLCDYDGEDESIAGGRSTPALDRDHEFLDSDSEVSSNSCDSGEICIPPSKSSPRLKEIACNEDEKSLSNSSDTSSRREPSAEITMDVSGVRPKRSLKEIPLVNLGKKCDDKDFKDDICDQENVEPLSNRSVFSIKDSTVIESQNKHSLKNHSSVCEDSILSSTNGSNEISPESQDQCMPPGDTLIATNCITGTLDTKTITSPSYKGILSNKIETNRLSDTTQTPQKLPARRNLRSTTASSRKAVKVNETGPPTSMDSYSLRRSSRRLKQSSNLGFDFDQLSLNSPQCQEPEACSQMLKNSADADVKSQAEEATKQPRQSTRSKRSTFGSSAIPIGKDASGQTHSETTETNSMENYNLRTRRSVIQPGKLKL